MASPCAPSSSGRRLRRLAAATLLAAAAPGCRSGSTATDSERAAATGATRSVASHPDAESTAAVGGGSPPELDDVIGPSEALIGEAGVRFRDAGPKADVGRDGPPDPACTGAEVSFASVVLDVRCALTPTRAKKLRLLLAHDAAVGLRQEASIVEGGRLALRVANHGESSRLVPVHFHAGLPAFTAVAEDERRTLYELEAPSLGLADGGKGGRAHVALIVLPPGGVAAATVALSPTIVRVLARGPSDPCNDARGAMAPAAGDGGACAPATLPKGRYVLHVAQLLTEIDVGVPARVRWENH